MMPEIGYCRDCKWWGKEAVSRAVKANLSHEGDGWQLCDKLGEDGALFSAFDFEHYGAGVETAPDFGCVHFTAGRVLRPTLPVAEGTPYQCAQCGVAFVFYEAESTRVCTPEHSHLVCCHSGETVASSPLPDSLVVLDRSVPETRPYRGQERFQEEIRKWTAETLAQQRGR